MKIFSKKKIRPFFFFFAKSFFPFPPLAQWQKKIWVKKNFQKKNYGQSGVFFLGPASLIQIWNSKKKIATFSKKKLGTPFCGGVTADGRDWVTGGPHFVGGVTADGREWVTGGPHFVGGVTADGREWVTGDPIL